MAEGVELLTGQAAEVEATEQFENSPARRIVSGRRDSRRWGEPRLKKGISSKVLEKED